VIRFRLTGTGVPCPYNKIGNTTRQKPRMEMGKARLDYFADLVFYDILDDVPAVFFAPCE